MLTDVKKVLYIPKYRRIFATHSGKDSGSSVIRTGAPVASTGAQLPTGNTIYWYL